MILHCNSKRLKPSQSQREANKETHQVLPGHSAFTESMESRQEAHFKGKEQRECIAGSLLHRKREITMYVYICLKSPWKDPRENKYKWLSVDVAGGAASWADRRDVYYVFFFLTI